MTTTTEAPAATCPPAKVTKDACAAQMIYVKIGAQCCPYPDPCSAADGARFNDSKCADPSH